MNTTRVSMVAKTYFEVAVCILAYLLVWITAVTAYGMTRDILW
jgi:hypothetical protein